MRCYWFWVYRRAHALRDTEAVSHDIHSPMYVRSAKDDIEPGLIRALTLARVLYFDFSIGSW